MGGSGLVQYNNHHVRNCATRSQSMSGQHQKPAKPPWGSCSMKRPPPPAPPPYGSYGMNCVPSRCAVVWACVCVDFFAVGRIWQDFRPETHALWLWNMMTKELWASVTIFRASDWFLVLSLFSGICVCSVLCMQLKVYSPAVICLSSAHHLLRQLLF